MRITLLIFLFLFQSQSSFSQENELYKTDSFEYVISNPFEVKPKDTLIAIAKGFINVKRFFVFNKKIGSFKSLISYQDTLIYKIRREKLYFKNDKKEVESFHFIDNKLVRYIQVLNSQKNSFKEFEISNQMEITIDKEKEAFLDFLKLQVILGL